jgi:hypothetical protein
MLKFGLSIAGMLLLTACTGPGTSPGADRRDGSGPGQLAKTDIDRVVEAHQREIFAGLRRLTEKLYRRNPREWRKSGQPDAQSAVARIYDTRHGWRLDELDGRRDIEALGLAFREDWPGDRVLALSVGLASMVQTAFDDKTEFFAADELDPQKLHDSARNVEIAVWRLSNARAGSGALFLLSNEGGAQPNLSFEREFGKVIGNLDTLSAILATRSERVIVRVVQSLATAVFLPVR